MSYNNKVPPCTKSYAAYNLNDDIRRISSSGGIFYLLAKETIDKNGVVYGATIDSNGKVYHKPCCNEEQLIDLLQSKYVQSEMRNCYQQVFFDLTNNKQVLFCGTTCQVYGLLSYLDISMHDKQFKENLITIDFICHGVPSKKVWKHYLQGLTSGKLIKDINFRDKSSGWTDFSLRIEYEDGTEYLQSWRKDSYVQGFIKNLYLRPSCYQCRFRGVDRLSNFTLADFWRVDSVLPEMFDDKGTSIVMIHNDYAFAIWDKINSGLKVCEINNKMVVETNSPLTKSVAQHPKRQTFLTKSLESPNIASEIKSFIKPSFLQKLKRRIKHIM